MIDEQIQLAFRISNILGFLGVFAVLLRIVYYTHSIILRNVVIFLAIASVGRISGFILDVYVFPDWKNIFSMIWNAFMLYWLVIYLFIVGTMFRNNFISQEQERLRLKTVKVMEQGNKFLEKAK